MSITNKLRYNKQKNLCITLLRKAKRKYYTDLKMSDINDNKKFWKNVGPNFSSVTSLCNCQYYDGGGSTPHYKCIN